MKHKLSDVLKHEFVGREIEIISCTNPSLVGKKGVVVDETKNTFTIDEKGTFKKVLKSHIIFRTKFQGKVLEIDGKELVFRPEDRIKRR
ncbi:ribonuclease P protein subunit [Candidatus Woesearchaeota archaeon]|nr:MAG: ribonuclease P protein subunit [Candidatus Woesearchaeota archaeon]